MHPFIEETKRLICRYTMHIYIFIYTLHVSMQIQKKTQRKDTNNKTYIFMLNLFIYIASITSFMLFKTIITINNIISNHHSIQVVLETEILNTKPFL